VLSLPFADPRELAMDVLRHVPEVDVLAPEDLLCEVRERMARALEVMATPGAGQTISASAPRKVTP
jgi:predicted DNA-binding transcriptional regulator YafY